MISNKKNIENPIKEKINFQFSVVSLNGKHFNKINPETTFDIINKTKALKK